MRKEIIGNATLYLGDCMEYMATLPDKAFELAIVDPPYGINHAEIAGKQSGTQYGNAASAKREYVIKAWDMSAPPLEYFKELMRISKNQIIWGANYFISKLPESSGWIFWDKDNGSNGFSDGELAFTSFSVGLRKFKFTWNGMIQGNMKNKEERFHPTQKPVALYKWLLSRYAKPGDSILDTHGGSGSSVIACLDLGFPIVWIEKDEDYFNSALERIKLFNAQLKLFKAEEETQLHQQGALFTEDK